MKRFSLVSVLASLVAFSSAAAQTSQPATRDVTFLSTSDSHYMLPDRKDNHNAFNRATMEMMNAITTVKWPDKLGGDAIKSPRGVVVLGDCIDDGDMVRKDANGTRQVSEEQNKLFLADLGLDGTDGVLKYPVFEGWGNHDGPPEGKGKSAFSFQAQIKQRNKIRLEKKLISSVSENGLHYSWDWDDVHFVQLNLYPADQQRKGVHYSPVWHDPQGSLSFLKKDLTDKVGKTGRPVVLMSHCGFDTDWWVKEDWKELYDAVKDYNVILYLYGHTGTGLRDWAPEGETKKLTCINDGHTDLGVFVIQIVGDRIRAGYYSKANVKRTKKPDNTFETTWDGKWEWKFLLDKKFSAPAPAVPAATTQAKDSK